MDRRMFLRAAAGSAIATTAGLAHGASPSRAGDDGGGDRLPSLEWRETSSSPVLSFPQVAGDPNTQRGFPTLLPVRSMLGRAAIDNWYLWLWTHDTSRTYLYTAPNVTGPYTDRGYGEAPTPYPDGYQLNHFSSGDIVWDARHRRFLSTPHGVSTTVLPGNAEPQQDSFITESTDGLTWRWLDDDNRPRLRCGPPGSVDSIHTGYGRLLRDLDGRLITHRDRNWWIYRAQRLDEGQTTPQTTYTPYLANAPDISADFTEKQKAYDSATSNTGLNNFGSFIRARRSHHVFMAQGQPNPPILPIVVMYNRTFGNDMLFPPAGVPLELPPRLDFPVEANVIRDPRTGVQYMAHTVGVFSPSTVEIWIYEGGRGRRR